MGEEIFGHEDILQIPLEKNEKVIREYIRNQLQEGYISDQISMEEYVDPFTEKEVGKK